MQLFVSDSLSSATMSQSKQCISLLVFLLLSLVAVSLASIEAANCTAEHGIDCISSEQTCGEESGDYEHSFDKAFSYCDPLMNAGYTRSPPESFSDCEIAANLDVSTAEEGRPSKVNVSFHTLNYKRYSILVQWSHEGDAVFRKGYQVTVERERPHDLGFNLDIFCVEGKDSRSLTILNGYKFSHWIYYRSVRVKVVAYPFPSDTRSKNEITSTGCLDCERLPRFCNELGPTNCNPPKYPPPSNVQLQTLVYNDTTSSEEIKRLDVHWDPVTPFSEPYYQKDQYKITYYVQLFYNTSNPDGWTTEHHVYKVTSTRTDRLSISLLPLNFSVVYESVSIGAHFPCAGISFERKEIGCGNTIKYSVPPPLPPHISTTSLPAPIQSTTTILPRSSTTTTTAALFTTSMSLTVRSPNYTWIIPFVVSITVLILLFAILIIFITARKRCRRKRSLNPSNDPSPLPPPLPPSAPHAASLGPRKTVVVYSSLCDKEEVEYLLQSVVNVLTSTQGVTVSYPDDEDFQRKCVVTTLLAKVSEADAVLIICNEAFAKDWKDHQTPLVNTLRHLVAVNIGSGASDWNKFAVVVFDNEHEYIPADLSILSTFNIGEIGKDQTERMIHFVTNTPLFKLASSPPRDPISPQSNVTMQLCDSHEEHCLDVVDPSSETTISTSLSSQNSSAITQDSSRASQEPA